MLNLEVGNPFTPEQEALNRVKYFIYREVATETVCYTIDQTARKMASDHCSVTVRIMQLDLVGGEWVDGQEWFETGYAARIGRDMDAYIRAELCALTQCLNLMGFKTTFNDSGKADYAYAESSWSKRDVLAAPNVEFAIREMERRGIDTADVKEYRDKLITDGERLTKNKLADFLFPNDVALVKPSEKRPAKRVEYNSVKQPIAVRSNSEAQELFTLLTISNIGEKEFESSPYKQVYSSLLLFCFAASDEEIQTLTDEYNSR
jgi:hypothetical protein